MTAKEILPLLEEWESRYKDLIKVQDISYKLFGRNESPLFEASWNMFDSYTDALSQLIGDKEKWLAWWAYDTNFGEKQSKAGKKGKEKKIKTLNDLIKLIQQ